jgi:hypothetical protein
MVRAIQKDSKTKENTSRIKTNEKIQKKSGIMCQVKRKDPQK